MGEFLTGRKKERMLAGVAWLLAAAFALLVLGGVSQVKYVTQPAAFSHKVHVDFGVACVSCHIGAGDAARASIPEVQVCALCHVPDRQNPKTPALLAERIRDMKPIGWKKLYALPRHVRFSHARHTQYGGVECTTCHGNVPERRTAMTHRLRRMDMADCINCHKREKITTDCLACHR